jgi:outer membrane protein assembly factor BamB
VSAAGTACSAGESGEDGRGRDEPDERGESGESGEQGGDGARPSAYGAGWGAVHADAANTDYAPVEGAADVALRWQRSLGGNVNLGPTVDDSGRVHVTTAAPGCHLYVLDAATGETVWCSEEVDRFAAASSPLLDADGRIFLADGEAMHAFDADGNVLWTTPIVGVPLSAQLTPEGRVIFVTHVGVVYVLRRDTGEPLLPPLELIPGATFDPAENMRGCPLGTADCPSANTIAVDLDSGRFFFTFWAPGAPQAGVRAMRYTEDPEPALTPVWTNDEIPGGSASSPDISADGRRIYLNDNAGSMHALDAATGDGIWSFPLGYVTGGSPSTSPEGRIMPAGGLGDSPLLALIDEGDAAAAAWRNDDETNKGIATQTAGDKAYATVAAGPGRTDLVVLDASTGEELDREPLPGTPLFSVGITVGPDGTVYVPSITGELYAFAAADEEPTLAEN